MDYTIDNINSLINSINNNTSVLKDMLNNLKDNCALLNLKLGEYAKNRINLSNKQISAYREYIREYEAIKNILNSSKVLLSPQEPIKLLSDISSIIGFCSNLLHIHTRQLEIMDKLLKLLEKSDNVLEMIA